MASREALGIIRAARAGQAGAQLALGKLYLLGSAGLPLSLPTALHWLDRAAQQDSAAQASAEACALIGTHIPIALARASARPLARWYERAYDDGVACAGLVLAQLVLGAGADGACAAQHDAAVNGAAGAACRAKALRALAQAAAAGVADAQWLLSQQPDPVAAPGAPAAPDQRWLRRAADAGLPQAQFALLDCAWDAQQWGAYAQRALPLARALAGDAAGTAFTALGDDARTLLSRCAQALARQQPEDAAPVDPDELHRFRTLAAEAGERDAQMALGLWWARMQPDGSRTAPGAGAAVANFKKAIRWLTLAGEQGLADAWYALSLVYGKPECSQRDLVHARQLLERAAGMGCRDAQLECGNRAWRARRERPGNDVRALYWLQKAAARGCAEAGAALRKIAPRPEGRAYTETGALSASVALAASTPLLAARLELAAIFRLTRAEALLLDVRLADQGHCLVIDIGASYGRGKRRLVLVETAQQRLALDRIVLLFDKVAGGPDGPEGNYRQRLYRLKTLVPDGV